MCVRLERGFLVPIRPSEHVGESVRERARSDCLGRPLDVVRHADVLDPAVGVALLSLGVEGEEDVAGAGAPSFGFPMEPVVTAWRKRRAPLPIPRRAP